MKTMKTIATNLSIFLFLTVSMPVHAGWMDMDMDDLGVNFVRGISVDDYITVKFEINGVIHTDHALVSLVIQCYYQWSSDNYLNIHFPYFFENANGRILQLKSDGRKSEQIIHYLFPPKLFLGSNKMFVGFKDRGSFPNLLTFSTFKRYLKGNKSLVIRFPVDMIAHREFVPYQYGYDYKMISVESARFDISGYERAYKKQCG